MGLLGFLVSLPFAWVRTIVTYYTTGTIYSPTIELRTSLWKNLVLMTELTLANNVTPSLIRRFFNKPAIELFRDYKDNAIVQRLPAFGTHVIGTPKGPGCGETTWVSRKDGKKVVLFFHGGGYALSMASCQLIAISCIAHMTGASIASLDYSLTINGKTFPTQLIEALVAYHALVEQGYTEITLLGDLAGGNLCLAMARVLHNQTEAKQDLGQFTSWTWPELPEPVGLVLVSPWVEPYAEAPIYPGVDTRGDFSLRSPDMGEWFIAGPAKDFALKYVHFSDDKAEDWKDVRAFKEKRVLVLYSERENLRVGIERFANSVKLLDVEIAMEKGGIHDHFLYVEALDYMWAKGAERGAAGDFSGKFGMNVVSKFLKEH